MPKVSVILPVYNEEKYLKQCLESLCHQTLSDIEIICIDDGSLDDSLHILQDYQRLDDRITIISQKNQYAGVARNTGMKYATGKYLLFLDSDDFFELDMLEKLYLRAEEDRLDVALCHYHFLDDRSGCKIETDFRWRDSFFPKGSKCFSGADIDCAGIFQSMVGWAWDKLFRTDFVMETGYEFPDFRSSEDGFFVYLLVARAKRIGVLEERLVWHRMYNGESLSNTKEQNWENGFRMIEMIYQELINQGIYNIYEQSFISWVIEFQVWYLTSLYEKNAFLKTYKYIQDHAEPEYKALHYEGEYICERKFVEYYNLIIELEPEQFLLHILKEREDAIGDVIRQYQNKGWVFPYEKIHKNAKLVIYGAGTVGHSYYEQLKATDYCSEIYIVDQNFQRCSTQDCPVERVEALNDIDFDYILVAISNSRVRAEVLRILKEKYNIPSSKIV